MQGLSTCTCMCRRISSGRGVRVTADGRWSADPDAPQGLDGFGQGLGSRDLVGFELSARKIPNVASIKKYAAYGQWRTSHCGQSAERYV